MGWIKGMANAQELADGRFSAYVLVTEGPEIAEKKVELPGEYLSEAEAIAAAKAWMEQNRPVV